MKTTLPLILVGLMLLPVPAQAERQGRRIDAIQSGRLYDPILTPQLNPSYHFQPNAEAQFLYELRKGRVRTDRVPEAQMNYFFEQLERQKQR
ncbi:hypothetical protein [Hoeflea olei]|uniref:Uncharacterized protein n=1 Tax=Hoeflea olei TaxID=1480615 RepID=A0A1C1YZN8_9HYPH|nr:hypothetical protein [Hoeflea olei]OCW59003.1 hypothetical protein AWJ14_04645 [Hoeflea olei]